jgi:hypothetical protein
MCFYVSKSCNGRPWEIFLIDSILLFSGFRRCKEELMWNQWLAMCIQPRFYTAQTDLLENVLSYAK